MKTLAQEEPAAIASQKTLAAADPEAASVSSAPSSENTAPSKTSHDHTALDIDLNSPAPNPAHTVRENESSPAAPATDRATNPTERCASLIEHQVAHLHHFGSDSLSVILRPDRHTELSLHLAARDGAIQASVRFERGDLPFLQSHWSELQEKLAQQNIRLAPLRESAHAQPSLSLNPQSLTNSNHSQLPQRRPQNMMAPEPELAWTGSATEPIKHRAPGQSVRSRKVRGWESWA